MLNAKDGRAMISRMCEYVNCGVVSESGRMVSYEMLRRLLAGGAIDSPLSDISRFRLRNSLAVI